jgi:hypothetical protein
MSSIKWLSLCYWIAVFILFGVLAYVPHAAPGPVFTTYYANSFRGDLFSAFVALAGFIFALKTFIIITMKKELYNHPEYIKRFQLNKALSPSLRRHAPLNNLRLILSWAVVCSLAAAICQLTLGLVPHWLCSGISLAIALYAVVIFSVAFVVMWSNLFDLLDFWDQEDGGS